MAVVLYMFWFSLLLFLVNSRGFRHERRNRQIRGACTDHHKCSEWLDYFDLYTSCQQERNRKHCPKTCKLCPTTSPPPTPTITDLTTTTVEPLTTKAPGTVGGGACIDVVKHCGYWARTGECQKSPDYMRANCILSCGWCMITTTTTSCVDQNPACPSWISTCSHNSNVRKQCKKTCDLCATSTPATSSSPTTVTTAKSITTTTTRPSTRTTTSTATNVDKSPRPTDITSHTQKKSAKPSPSTVTITTARTVDTPKQDTSTLQNIPSARPQHAKSAVNTAVVIGISVSGIVMVACVVLAVCFYKRRKNKRNGRLINSEPGNTITMEPFGNSGRDSGIVDCDIYEDPNTKPANEQVVYHVLEGPSNQEPVYHVLEDNKTNQQKAEPMYACASPTGRQNKAFDPEYEYTVPGGIVRSSLDPQKPHSDASKVSMETPYYHVLENPVASAQGQYQELFRPTQSGYQPIIRREAAAYEPLQNRKSDVNNS